LKNHLTLIFVFFLSFATTEIEAQIKTGYVFGANLSTISLKSNGMRYNTKSPLGFHFGGYIELPLNNNVAFQSGLLFSAKGSNYEIDSISYSISPIYIEIPVNAVLSFGSEKIRGSLFGGPYFAFGIGGYKIDDGGELKNINYGRGAGNDMKTLDIGFNFGAGVSIRGLLISLQYGLGLTNISPESSNGSEMKNRVVGISIRAGGNGLSAAIGR
jgi:hypothetical protein